VTVEQILLLIISGMVLKDSILQWRLIDGMLNRQQAPAPPSTGGGAGPRPSDPVPVPVEPKPLPAPPVDGPKPPAPPQPAPQPAPVPTVPPVAPPVVVQGLPRFQNITATSFAGVKDSAFSKQSAYTGKEINSSAPGAALPYHFPTPPVIRVFLHGKTVDCPIVDVGPWNTHDAYWDHPGARPQAESGTDTTGRHTNHAGLDLTPGAWSELGKTGDLDAVTDVVSWDFVSVLERTGPTAPVVPPAPAPAGGTVLQSNVWPTQAECPSFYCATESAIRANLVDVQCPWLMNGKTHTIQIHRKCAASLERVLNFIWETAGKSQEKIHEFGYDVFDGSFNWRVIAGTSTPSVHSYAAATDWNAAANPQHASLAHTKFQENSLITTAFKRESWIWGGDWSSGSIDAMHYQAARVR
jgi:hypothetical protein